MLPLVSHPKWAAVICGENEPEFKSLSTKILLNNIKHMYMSYPNQERMEECIEKLRTYFEKNRKNKKVQSDLRSIFR
jgi:hypothetical protein